MSISTHPPPRVLVLAPGEVFGGAERQILTLLAYMRTQLPDLKLALFHDAELASRARNLKYDVEILGARRLWDSQALQRLGNIIKEHQIQVVHIHGYRAAAYAALAHKQHAFASVKTEHGAVESHGLISIRSTRSRLYRLVENYAARYLSADLVYVTKDLRQRCTSEHKNMSRHVIYNGIDDLSDYSTDVPQEFNPEFRHIVIVGRLEPVKGIDTAILAMATDAVPSNVMLHIIGSGPMKGKLTQLIHDRGLEHKIHLLGFRHDIYRYLAHAEALLIPSLHEGLPYTLLEAMMLKTPVIATEVGGLAEILINRKSALLVPSQDPLKLASAISILFSEPELAASLREKGHSLAMNEFSARSMGKNYLKLFELAAARMHISA